MCFICKSGMFVDVCFIKDINICTYVYMYMCLELMSATHHLRRITMVEEWMEEGGAPLSWHVETSLARQDLFPLCREHPVEETWPPRHSNPIPHLVYVPCTAPLDRPYLNYLPIIHLSLSCLGRLHVSLTRLHPSPPAPKPCPFSLRQGRLQGTHPSSPANRPLLRIRIL